jgi:hypothetical protein
VEGSSLVGLEWPHDECNEVPVLAHAGRRDFLPGDKEPAGPPHDLQCFGPRLDAADTLDPNLLRGHYDREAKEYAQPPADDEDRDDHWRKSRGDDDPDHDHEEETQREE